MAFSAHYPALFSPIRIRGLEVPNRVVVPGIGTNFTAAHGYISDSLLTYYERRAAGGAGTVVVEAASIDRGGLMVKGQLGISDDSYIPGLRRLAEAIRKHGSIALIQITHGGAKSMPGPVEEPVSPSGVQLGARPTRALEMSEIPYYQQKYVDAVRRALEAGFDGVEMHACHLHLISQFVSPYTNRRTDDYGGTVENRGRFLLEIIRRARALSGKDFLLSVRINGYELYEGGLRLEQAIRNAHLLEQEDVDVISVSALSQLLQFTFEGKEYSYATSVLPKSAADGFNAQFGVAIKQVISKPVVVTGKVLRPELGEQLVREGKADFVGFARASIADPEFPNKSARGEPYTACSECNACIKLVALKGLPMTCPVNPEYRAYREALEKG